VATSGCKLVTDLRTPDRFSAAVPPNLSVTLPFVRGQATLRHCPDRTFSSLLTAQFRPPVPCRFAPAQLQNSYVALQGSSSCRPPSTRPHQLLDFDPDCFWSLFSFRFPQATSELPRDADRGLRVSGLLLFLSTPTNGVRFT